ncbi:hypothetical protein [Arthrobacter sp. MMS18-M83]|uniref:hypothetical protein n=1 Tax=Arthrobacter sp. MMS18-M83 TaxID=2996261 RepID=UPI00227A1C8A|nr:hypothetical protein [Arthrobacter sp. MMS18-M83]WAH95740.1 hypothetical protein OW521_14970 [Arthrobacter sp. MMS18-M83]
MKIQTAPSVPVENGVWQLLDRWRDQSRRDGWRYVRDWFVPEVEGMALSVMNGNSSLGAARHLGASRSFHGVGIAETMTDLRSLFTAAGQPVDQSALQDIAVGWVEAREQDQQPSSCTDVTTGLATTAHFERALQDARRTANGSGKFILGAFLFPLMDKQLKGSWTLSVEVGRICAQEFTGESAIQVYRHDRVDFLIQGSTGNLADALRCKRRLETLRNGALGPCKLRYQPIPSTDAEAMRLMAQLRGIPVRPQSR